MAYLLRNGLSMTRMNQIVGLLAVVLASCVAGDADVSPENGNGGINGAADTWYPGDSDGAALLAESSGPVYSLIATTDSWFKSSTASSADLDDSERCLVTEGQRLTLDRFALPADDGAHFEIRLLEPLEGCRLTRGFVYGDHFAVADHRDFSDLPACAYVLTATENSNFKSRVAASADLGPEERCVVRPGEQLALASTPTPGFGMHFQVTLVEPREGCGFTEGYVYGPDFGLQPDLAIEARQSTVLKADVAPTSELDDDEICSVDPGVMLALDEPPLFVGGDHYQIILARRMPGCDFDEAYVYGPHFGLSHSHVVPVTASTVFKSEPAQSSELNDDDVCTLEAGDLLELRSVPDRGHNGHLRLELARPRPGCRLTTGYVYEGHVDTSAIDFPQNPLDVPYYYQYFNSYEPCCTCGLTSGAMLLGYWGRNLTPDTLYVRYGKSQGQSPPGLAYIYRRELGYGQGTYAGTRAQIRRHLDAGRPVVIHGAFTGSGHIMIIIGYDETGWFVNDPAGRWTGCYRCGYANRTSTNGRGAHYSYSAMNSVMNSDGNIWMSVGDVEPFEL